LKKVCAKVAAEAHAQVREQAEDVTGSGRGECRWALGWQRVENTGKLHVTAFSRRWLANKGIYFFDKLLKTSLMKWKTPPYWDD
jgi:hypothetical protein